MALNYGSREEIINSIKKINQNNQTLNEKKYQKKIYIQVESQIQKF